MVLRKPPLKKEFDFRVHFQKSRSLNFKSKIDLVYASINLDGTIPAQKWKETSGTCDTKRWKSASVVIAQNPRSVTHD